MPTVFQEGPYRFFFYANDRHEPEHIHVRRDENVANSWLDPVRLARSGGFSRTELGTIHGMLTKHQAAFMEAWRDYFES